MLVVLSKAPPGTALAPGCCSITERRCAAQPFSLQPGCAGREDEETPSSVFSSFGRQDANIKQDKHLLTPSPSNVVPCFQSLTAYHRSPHLRHSQTQDLKLERVTWRGERSKSMLQPGALTALLWGGMGQHQTQKLSFSAALISTTED